MGDASAALLSGQGDDRDPSRNRSRRRRYAMRGCMLFQAMARPSSFSFYCMLALARTYIIYVQIKVINNKRGRRVIVITSISIINMQDGWMSLLVNNERELLICHR